TATAGAHGLTTGFRGTALGVIGGVASSRCCQTFGRARALRTAGMDTAPGMTLQGGSPAGLAGFFAQPGAAETGEKGHVTSLLYKRQGDACGYVFYKLAHSEWHLITSYCLNLCTG